METPAGHSLDRGLVGNPGADPGATAISERPLHRLGSCPCGCGTSRTCKAVDARPGSDRVPSASRIAHPSRSWAESDPRRLPALTCFRAGAVTYRLASEESRRFELPSCSSSSLHAFQACPRAIRTLSTCGRRADRTPAGLTPRPPVSNRVPYHSRPAFQRAPGGIRTLTSLRTRTPEARASACSATGAWSGRRDLNSPYDHGEVACCR
jgi:hypothetical protein